MTLEHALNSFSGTRWGAHRDAGVLGAGISRLEGSKTLLSALLCNLTDYHKAPQTTHKSIEEKKRAGRSSPR